VFKELKKKAMTYLDQANLKMQNRSTPLLYQTLISVIFLTILPLFV